MMWTPLRALVLSFFAVALLVAAPVAQAKSAKEVKAEEVYAEGVEHYRAGRFAAAASTFEKANALWPDAGLLWNIGRAWEQAGELKKGQAAYIEFLGHEDVDADLRKKVAEALVRIGGKLQARKDAKTFEQKMAQLSREISEAERDKNAELIGRLRRELEEERELASAADEVPEPAKPEPAKPEPEAKKKPDPVRPVPAPRRVPADTGAVTSPTPFAWVSIGVGVAAVGAGAGLIGDAEVRRARIRWAMENTEAGHVTTMRLSTARDLEEQASLHSLIGIVSAGVGGALVITGVVLALATGGDPIESTVAVGATPLPGGGALHALGRF